MKVLYQKPSPVFGNQAGILPQGGKRTSGSASCRHEDCKVVNLRKTLPPSPSERGDFGKTGNMCPCAAQFTFFQEIRISCLQSLQKHAIIHA